MDIKSINFTSNLTNPRNVTRVVLHFNPDGLKKVFKTSQMSLHKPWFTYKHDFSYMSLAVVASRWHSFNISHQLGTGVRSEWWDQGWAQGSGIGTGVRDGHRGQEWVMSPGVRDGHKGQEWWPTVALSWQDSKLNAPLGPRSPEPDASCVIPLAWELTHANG